MKFANPPLVELIAELRWAMAAAPIPVQNAFGAMQLASINANEEFFMRFGAKVSVDGFDSFERVVPSGFPTFPYQPVYRYRYGAPDKGTALYQLGAGLFSANITPPYDNWEMFKPVVARGIASLLQSRPISESELPFSVCSLRYIDAFRGDLASGMSTSDFVRDVLGFSLEPPSVVKSMVSEHAEIKPTAEFVVPLGPDMVMVLKVGDGNVNGEPAIILDTIVTITREITSTVEGALEELDRAHDVIRKVFVDVTKSIALQMQPE